MALENCLLRAVGDDSERFISANADEVISHFDAGIFNHLAGLFLGDLLYQVVRGEERALPPKVKDSLHGVVQAKADRIVRDFESRFGGKSMDGIAQVSYGHLFDVIAAREDWFLDQLRRS
jgi:hypothetical protein